MVCVFSCFTIPLTIKSPNGTGGTMVLMATIRLVIHITHKHGDTSFTYTAAQPLASGMELNSEPCPVHKSDTHSASRPPQGTPSEQDLIKTPQESQTILAVNKNTSYMQRYLFYHIACL